VIQSCASYRVGRAVPSCSCPLRRRRAAARRVLPCVCFEYTVPLLRIVSVDPVRQQYLFPRYTVYAVSRAPGAPKWVYVITGGPSKAVLT
jgi:hypothetical protein